MYDKILIPTDGSEKAEVAAGHAAELAEKHDAELHALYVVDVGVESSVDAVDELMSELEEAEELDEKAEEALNSVKERFPDAVGSVEYGKPYREIHDYVEENDIDLVVMGTRGRKGLERILLGSVTEKVLRSSDVPVLTVRNV
ncbi:MAG: universal stress protein [Candidatus Nanohaloarchaea archaeon]